MGRLSVPRHRRLHRRHQHGLLSAQSDGHLGQRAGGGRLASHPHATSASRLRRTRAAARRSRARPRPPPARARPPPRMRSPKPRRSAWDRGTRSTTTWNPTAAPPRIPTRCWHSCRPGPPSCTPAATCRASTQARIRRRGPGRAVRDRLCRARRALDRQLERRAEHGRSQRAQHRVGGPTSAFTSTSAPTTRPTTAPRSTSTATTSTPPPPPRQRPGGRGADAGRGALADGVQWSRRQRRPHSQLAV